MSPTSTGAAARADGEPGCQGLARQYRTAAAVDRGPPLAVATVSPVGRSYDRDLDCLARATLSARVESPAWRRMTRSAATFVLRDAIGHPYGRPDQSDAAQLETRRRIVDVDVVVVGAGSAGAALAARLSEDAETNVLLIEAGPDYPDIDQLPDDLKYSQGAGHIVTVSPRHNWEYPARGTATGPELVAAAGRATGGSSAINGTLFIRGVPDDFNRWAADGCDRWTFDQVLPYYRRIERDADFHDDFHGTDGPIPVLRQMREQWTAIPQALFEACRDAGFAEVIDANGATADGIAPCPYNNPGRIRYSTALGYLAPARHRPNLSIRSEVRVLRIVFDGTTAAGLDLDGPDGVEFVRCPNIVLSAGVYGSPMILLRSGVGPAADLRELGIEPVRDLPGVGQNLRDHIAVNVRFRVHAQYVEPSDASYGQNFLRYTSSRSPVQTDMFVREVQLADEFRFWTGTYFPLGSGQLRLADADPSSPPVIDFRYLSHPDDRRRLREAVRLCLRLSQHVRFQPIIAERLAPLDADLVSDLALDDWLEQSVECAVHVTSTCRMGAVTDPGAVVDQEGRVIGLTGVRVADASIMPRPPRGNTNATTIMIGERIAEFMQPERLAATR